MWIWRIRGYCYILPGLKCHVRLRPWRQRCGVPRRWNWWWAHQECAGFSTVCTGEREKQMRVWGKLITLMKKACYQVHGQLYQARENPKPGCHKSVSLAKSWTTIKSGYLLKKQKKRLLAEGKSETLRLLNTQMILPKIAFSHRIDKLSVQRWKLRTQSQGMNGPDENKVYFTQNWRIGNEHFVILALWVFMKWKNWGELVNYESKIFPEESWSRIKTLFMSSWPRYRRYNMRSIVWISHGIFRMPNQYAVDSYLTFPVKLRYFLFLLIQGDCWASTEIRSLMYGIYMIYGETFLLNPLRFFFSTTCSGMHKPWDGFVTGNILVQASTGKPVA